MRAYNFSAGPAMLPEAVLLQAQEELVEWHGCGMSVMEMGHRSKEFNAITEQVETTLRDLLSIPDNYHVLFLSGGATAQFAMVPINLLNSNNGADYIDSGHWSQKALKEAQRFGRINVLGGLQQLDGRTALPQAEQLQCHPDSAYVHYTANETIDGLEFHWCPETGDVPLVTDMTSTLLSRPCDVSRHGIIYAGAQKNLGHAGVTIVIIREDLVGHVQPNMPTMLDYQQHVKSNSRLNTPPTYSWYFAGLVFDWVKREGGVEEMARRSKQKINKIYQKIDSSDFYINNVDAGSRSWMNVPFQIHDAELEETFLAESRAAGLLNLRGHRSVGGMRASVYIAMPEAGVDALVAFMNDFEQRYG